MAAAMVAQRGAEPVRVLFVLARTGVFAHARACLRRPVAATNRAIREERRRCGYGAQWGSTRHRRRRRRPWT